MHPDVAMSIVNLGGLYSSWSRFTQSETEFKKAMDIYRSAFGDLHPGVAQCLNSLAGIALERGDYDKGEVLYKKTYDVKAATLGKEHPETALTLNGESRARLMLTHQIWHRCM